MFNNNVAQTYNFQDASQEIIIMLLGSFLFGALITWLLSKLFNNDYNIDNNNYRYEQQDNNEINTLKQSPNSQSHTTSEVRIVEKPTNPVKTKITPDDLTKISGIDSAMQNRLKESGISSFVDLRDIDTDNLTAFKQTLQNPKGLNRELETWPHQASLAAKGDWNKLKDYQGFIQRVQVASNTSANTAPQIKPYDADDLTKLIGISPEIEGVLNKKEIYSFKQLSLMDNDSIKNHVSESDIQLIESETESWPHQAAMADKGQWDELKIYQDFMHSDSGVVDESKNGQTQLNNQNETIKPANNVTHISRKKESTNNNKETSDLNLSDHDDLKKIEGIGPKIEEVLNNGGIYTFSQLYKSDRNRLRKLLDDAGNQFRMHDPESWPHQAGMADRSEWDELKTYQNSITKSLKSSSEATENSGNEPKQKTETKKESKINADQQTDDLRRIEGIGPKIQELLNNAGIKSFKDLSESSRDQIKTLLNDAGPQFRMHEPESWAHQAKLAATARWKELEEYQDFLISGRE